MSGPDTSDRDKGITEERLNELPHKTLSSFEQNCLEQSFELLPHPVLVIDVKTLEVVKANKKAISEFGELASNVRCFELTHDRPAPCDESVNLCTIAEVLRTKASVSIEHLHSDDDGETLIEVHAVPIFGTNGDVTHIIEFLFDITTYSATELQLLESEKKHRFLTEHMADILFTIDLNMNVTYTSPGVFKERGYSPEEVMSQPIGDMLAEDSQELAMTTLQEIMQLEASSNVDTDRTWTLELEVLKKDGTIFLAEMTFSLIRDREGKLISFLGVSRNIDERKKTEAKNARLQEQVSHMQRMDSIGELAGGIAHDFNNLLTVISGHASLAINDLEDGKSNRGDIMEIQKAAKRAASLTSQILAYSRKQMLTPKVFNLNHTITEIYKFLHRLLGENIIVDLVFEENIWNISADEMKIQQVIINLATNARDAMLDGGKLKIETLNKSISEQDVSIMPDAKPGKYVCISVTDEGCGIEFDRLFKIFEPFYTTKDVGKGTGLGLSMAYGTAKQHGGWINVESTMGKGTTFEVYLPAIDQKEDEDVKADEKIRRGVELFGKGKKVLIVEDEGSVRDLLDRIMKRHGFEVTIAASVKAAKRLFESEQGKFDIILSDIVLSDKNVTGCDLALDLQQQNPDIKVILTSGYVDVVEKWPQILDAEFPFLNKPFEVAELVGLVRKVLDL